MVQGEPGSPPEWKILWDKARNLTRAEDYPSAAKTYAALFEIKPNIEEANWEYYKVLVKVEDFSTATKIIGGLLDYDPNNSEYLLAGGAIATHWKNYEAASRYYGRVFEKDPLGVNSDIALLGLATSLRYLEKKEHAFALLEQLSLRQPGDNAILYQLAVDADALEKDEKARTLYARLLENPEVDDRILFQAIRVFDVPGYEKKRSALLLQYIERHPGYMPFRRELAEYYKVSGQFEAALRQLRYLADNSQDNDEFLLEAATICQRDLNSPGQALFFFERYLQKHPDHPEISRKINDIQSALAGDFLSVVENGGAGRLWKDLADLTPNRLAIFLEIADLLENKGQTEELIEILTIIHQHSPAKDRIALRIAQQYYRLRQYSQVLKYLLTVTDQKNKTKAYYLLKGDTEYRLGLEMAALTSFELGLSVDPLDPDIRTRCLDLAGKLGNVDTMEVLFESGLQRSDRTIPVDFVFGYLELLSRNFLFLKYDKINTWARFHFAGMTEIITRLDIHQASALRKEGKIRRAEQLLRQLLTRGVLVDEVLFQLTENAVIDKDPAAAASWYQALQQETGSIGAVFPFDPQGCRMLLLKVKLLQAEEKYGTAQALLDNYRPASKKIPLSVELQPLLARLDKQRCWLSFYQGNLSQALDQCRKLLDQDIFDPELLTLRGILNRKLTRGDRDKDADRLINIAGNPVVTRLLALAAKEMEYQQYDIAEKHLRTALKTYPQSVIGNALWGELMFARGHSEIAAEYFGQLIEQFPEEPYFYQKRIEVETRRGRYDQGLVIMIDEVGATDGVDELTAHLLTSADDLEKPLTLARLLWGNKQQEKALLIYRQLLARPVLEQLGDTFKQQQIEHPYLTREATFWNRMIHMLRSEPEVLAELMEPSFLIDNRDNEAGKIVSQFFERYSWQKVIGNEYMARKAIYERNYYYAEQSYKRLLKEDSSEGMLDLATVYGKIGKYRKEAQIYEAMQNSGATSPGLDESIERNILQISPQNILNAAYEEREGRDGSIDIARTTIGTSFRFTPDLDKDIRLLYVNNRFESLDTDQSAGSNFLYAVANYEFSKAYELVLGAGTEKLAGEGEIGYQYEMALKGQLDDYINAYVLFEKRPVDDTIAAIKQRITFQSIETGLSLETPIGLSVGGDVRHRYYNDGNSQNRFHGYSSYSIFGESLQLALRYDYQFLNNQDQGIPVAEFSVNAVADEVPYWSPSSFTEHRASLRFQHDFLGYEQETKKSMSYYAVETALGFEDNENISYTTKFDIFLEMSPHFLLKGNFTLSKSDDYEEKGLSMSLHYRW